MTMRLNLTVKDPTVKVTVQCRTSRMLLPQNKDSRLHCSGPIKARVVHRDHVSPFSKHLDTRVDLFGRD
jgi:hypothetical protein